MSDKNSLKKWNDQIPKDVKHLLRRLDKAGYEAYIVGGCVRDMYLDRKPHDWDITTDATPDEILALFSPSNKCFDVGKEHGTITVMVRSTPYEITTYRIDGTYSDNRRPDTVEFTNNLLADLERRDFTMNAMAYNPDKEIGLIDPHNGTEAIDSKVINCVGKPVNRFAEDGLRILRALRFAAQLDFNIEINTWSAIHKKKHLLQRISAERINAEVSKILMSNKCGAWIFREFSDVFIEFVPEIEAMIGFEQNNPYHDYDVWEHTLHCMENVPPEADLITRLAILLHDIGKPLAYTELDGRGHFYGHANYSSEIAHKILTRLKFSKEVIDNTTQLISLHDVTFTPTKSAVKRLLNKMGEKQLKRLFILRECDIKGQTELGKTDRLNKVKEMKEILDWVIKQSECFQLKDLAINGKDLIQIGIPEGKIIGTILNLCLAYVIDGTVDNTKENLLEIVNKFFASNPSLYKDIKKQVNQDA